MWPFFIMAFGGIWKFFEDLGLVHHDSMALTFLLFFLFFCLCVFLIVLAIFLIMMIYMVLHLIFDVLGNFFRENGKLVVILIFGLPLAIVFGPFVFIWNKVKDWWEQRQIKKTKNRTLKGKNVKAPDISCFSKGNAKKFRKLKRLIG